ncbi:MAG: hypothetical protein ACLQQ4_02880 [Bacteroidia bacterium]
MKKNLVILGLVFLYATTVFAQQDSTFKRGVIIKINPPEILLGAANFGEIGGFIQIPVNKNIDIQFGFGINNYGSNSSDDVNANGSILGYVIRAGLYHFLSEKKYISLQFFYRKWNDNNIEFYIPPSGSLQAAENADEDPSNTNDGIINPYSVISPLNGDNTYGYTIDNAIINVYALDFVYGKQIPIFHSRHFIFEYYFGGGLRVKNITLHEIMYQVLGTNYNSTKSYTYNALFPDIKAGIMFGFKF